MAPATLTADTSMVVPFVSMWHPMYSAVRGPMADVTRLPGHVMVESLSSLTRMPGGFAVSPEQAVEAVRAAFPEPPIVLGAEEYLSFVDAIRRDRITGGAVYDALVGFTAKVAGARLLSRDRRAERTYRAVGADYELVG